MPLLLLDLDDTLIDRASAFRAGVVELLTSHSLPHEDVDWVMALEGDGYTPREDVASAMIRRYGMRLPVSELVGLLRRGALEHITLADETAAKLRRAVQAGWTPVIVTNGTTEQQEAKVKAVGLDALVAGWVISEAVGVAKPDPGIFHAAADLAGLPLDQAWMVGDHAEKDVASAAELGLVTVWLSRGRRWSHTGFRPRHVAGTPAQAIGYALDAGRMAG